MAKKLKQSTSPGKGLFAGFLTAGVTALLYSLVFPLNAPLHYLVAGGLSALTGWLSYTMFSGLDTSKQAASLNELPVTGNEAVDKVIKKGQDLLTQIRKEDEMIPDPVLSESIVQLDKISTRIFQTIIEQPGKAPQIRRFMDYYLPTTLKMLTGYRRLTERGVSGQEAVQTKRRIQSAMQVVIGAFEKQLSTLYQNDMLDISTDIDVLETMLKQDSLLGSEFSIKSNPGQSQTARQDTTQTGSTTGQATAQAQMKEK